MLTKRRRLAAWRRRGGIAIAVASAACSEPSPTSVVPDSDPGPFIVSAPISELSPSSHALATRLANGSSSGAAGVATTFYVSLPPNSVPAGSTAQIRDRNTGGNALVPMVNGGFDPVAIVGNTGDGLTVKVNGGGALLLSASIKVPRRRPPTLVRADPPNGKADVPLNTQVVVVLSEPVDPTTIRTAMHLFIGTQAVPGTASLSLSGLVAAFTPDAPLTASTTYVLVVTTALRNLNGEALDQAARIEFTTEAEPVARPSAECLPTQISSALGTFTPVGSMLFQDGSSTRLPDGRVVFYAGGPAGSAPQAELYDPSTQAFSRADEMITLRGGHPAVALPNGAVQFFDGTMLQDGRVFFTTTSGGEVYDPTSGGFTTTGSYAHGQPSWTTRTLLRDGRVLLTGYENATFTGATELFDPRTGTFKETGPMQAYSDTPGWGILLPDGTVLFVQWNFNGLDDDVELYDPSTESFSRIGCVQGDYEYSAAVGLRDGSVLITGGQLPGGNGTPVTMRYLPGARTFVFEQRMTVGRHNHTATLLLDGTVLVAGGFSVWPNRTLTAELYRPAQAP